MRYLLKIFLVMSIRGKTLMPNIVAVLISSFILYLFSRNVGIGKSNNTILNLIIAYLVNAEYLLSLCSGNTNERMFIIAYPFNLEKYIFTKQLFWCISVILTWLLLLLIGNTVIISDWEGIKLKYVLTIPWISTIGICCFTIFIHHKAKVIKSFIFTILTFSFILICMIINYWPVVVFYTIMGLCLNHRIVKFAAKAVNSLQWSDNFEFD